MTEIPPPLGAYLESGIVSEVRAVGSRVTSLPFPDSADEDWLCFVPDLGRFLAAADADDFELGGSGFDESPTFASVRRGKLNLIASTNLEFCNRFLAASSVAKRLNLRWKGDRIALFRAVLYAEPCDPIGAPFGQNVHSGALEV